MISSAKKGAIAWMCNNPVAANLLMLTFLVGGAISYFLVTKEVMPDFQFDVVQVEVSYPGASPEEVNQGIILVTEEAIRGIAGIKEVNSTATEGKALVQAEVEESADPNKITQDIKNAVDRITTFPLDAERPVVSLPARKMDAVEIAIYGDTDEKTIRALGEEVRNNLLSDPDVSQADLLGIRDLEISIFVPQENLRKYNLTIQQIADKLKSKSVEVPGGGIKQETGEILLRVRERRDFGLDFSETQIINSGDGTTVKLGDIATIDDGLADTDYFATYNGKPAVLIEVYRIGDETPQSVVGAVRNRMEALQEQFPKGIEFAILRDSADTYNQRIMLMLKNGLMGLILVLLTLGLFLELRLAFWVMMGIPTSFLGCFLFMPGFDLSLNMMTSFAFILALGIVVDDAIVVGENVYSHQKNLNGHSIIDATVRGTQEVGTPVIFSILTNIVAFIPLLLLPGTMGNFMRHLPWIVIIAFVISWVESLYILPSHLAHVRKKERKGLGKIIHVYQQKFSEWFTRIINNKYGPFLDRALHWRYVIVAAAIAIFICAIGVVNFSYLGFENFPQIESDFSFASAELPFGIPINRTNELSLKLNETARKTAEKLGCPDVIEGVFSEVGKSGSHTLEMRVYLRDAEYRNKAGISTEQFTTAWREETGDIPGVKTMQMVSNRSGPGGRDRGLTIELKHNDTATLEKMATAVANEISLIDNIKDVDSGFQLGKEQIDFKINAEGEQLGITANYLGRKIRSLYEGAEVTRQQRGRDEIKVKVRLPESERKTLFQMQDLIIQTPTGEEVPLKEIANFERGRAYTKITRRDGHRTMSVSANLNEQHRAGEVISRVDNEVMPQILTNFSGSSYSYQGRQADDRESLNTLKFAIPLVLLAIYALLAIPFKSYLQPLIVMMSIPLGIVGALIGHLIMGYNLSMIGCVGILALSGIVVNDSLVLVDFTNSQRKLGYNAHDAVTMAGIKRFRPILLTTLTTFCGLMPMILETSRQARFLIPMAISLGFGILFATVITLVLIPSMYMIIDDVQKIFHREN